MVIPLQQKEFRSMKMFVVSFIPYVLVSLISDMTEVANPDFYEANDSYFKNAILIAFI